MSRVPNKVARVSEPTSCSPSPAEPQACAICAQDSKEKDLIEKRLERQAIELHRHGMALLQVTVTTVDLRPQLRESLVGQAIRLLRLHNETVDALGRYRRNGEQKVVVQYFHVENGGKAVVGTVVQ
jgi:hypothetical protein